MKEAEIYYSPSTKGFYNTDIHADEDIPGDRVFITAQEWVQLLDEQSAGREIILGTHGRPITVDRDPTLALLASRDAALRETDWLVARHRDEVELETPTTLSGEDYRLLQQWRAALRNLRSHPDFPRMTLPPNPLS